MTAAGVPLELARDRRARIEDLRYRIDLSIPAEREEPITGVLEAGFRLSDAETPLAFDFAAAAGEVRAVFVNGGEVDVDWRDEHLVIAAEELEIGDTEVKIDFVAGDSSLNRHDDYLYTLFVPDRARFAFPLFDQPDLKARVSLSLEIPSEWEAVANGPERSRDPAGERTRVEFAETEPISSYLLAFAAGRFAVESATRDGRDFRFLHREDDPDAIERNLDELFDLHATALSWLEEYTGIEHPFQKFDFVAVPAFQYGGMEHPGSIFYRDRSLFLEESATQSQILGRASLIAHETAHMWFGNLVTMEWFSDVWMKEVFANFMAAKVVHPTFPEVDHELRFLLSHYPAAYGVDRTPGANPVRQPLDNLARAGSLYGAIIYQKAPVLMKQLEQLMGEEEFRRGIQRYLENHRYGNATWPDLIAVLDPLTEEDLGLWSRIWVEEAGRPEIEVALELNESTTPPTVASLQLTQSDPWQQGRLWNQRLDLVLGKSDGSSKKLPAQLRSATLDLPAAVGLEAPDFVLVNGGGVGYGRFKLSDGDRTALLAALPTLPDPRLRMVAWLSLGEEVLDGRLPPIDLIDVGLRMLDTELEELEIQRVLGTLDSTFWRHLDVSGREEIAPALETTLWRRLERSERPTVKAAVFGTYRSVASTSEALERLLRMWRGELEVPGLALGEGDLTALALALAVREVEGWEEILETESERLTNPDRRARFEFLRPAVSADPDVRERFFESLLEVENRQHEPWVLAALRLLHHPLRAADSERFLLPALQELEETQRTGDIFFPLGWLQASLGGHSSPSAAAIAREFIADNPDLERRLRGKLLQAADPLFRAARIVYGDVGASPSPL